MANCNRNCNRNRNGNRNGNNNNSIANCMCDSNCAREDVAVLDTTTTKIHKGVCVDGLLAVKPDCCYEVDCCSYRALCARPGPFLAEQAHPCNSHNGDRD